MELGIIGLPQSGKTTLFNALTQGNVPTGISGSQLSVHTAVIDVPDERIVALNALFHPQKIVHAKVTYADIAGLDGESSKSGISGPLHNTLSAMDGFIHVVRHFESSHVPHFAGSINPERDVIAMEAELILNDLIVVERKLARLEEERQRGGYSRDKLQIAHEKDLFTKLHEMLSQEIPLRHFDFLDEEEKILSSYAFLSKKPQLIVINQSEDQTPLDINLPFNKTKLVFIPAKLEMDIAQLPEEETALFREEYGLTEPSLNRFVRLSYGLLNLISFFTAGEKEVHAWTVKLGASALEAAGTIHSDMERGFIRAEIIGYDELIKAGGYAEARQLGKLRLEGKKYIVQDGDVITIRFNI